MTAPASIYEQAGRSAKVLKICMSLDGALLSMGTDPFSAAALEYVLSMSGNAWRIAAAHARVPLASETTMLAVESVYAQRLATRRALQKGG